MRHVKCLALLVPTLALAAGTAVAATTVAPGISAKVVDVSAGDGRDGPPGPQSGPGPDRGARFTIGTVDTVGGTTYDNQFGGPSWRLLVNSVGRGIYVAWMYSASMSGSTFPDRNMRLNYYDYALQRWVYSDSTDFMVRGLNAFARRTGFGNIDVDTGGTPYISCHAALGGATRPWIAKGQSGGYSDSTGLPVCYWPPVAVGRNGAVHILPISITPPDTYKLVYCRIAPDSWPHWSTPLAGITPYPGFPSQGIAASKVSDKVSLVWEVSQSRQAYQMHSTDGGLTWDSSAALTPPDAYGGDTLTGYGVMSLFPVYDRHDRLHVVANLLPVVNDTALLVPSQIWHYCPDNSPTWSRIHVANCNPANMRGTVGDNATYACRPTIGEDQAGGLYVVWEQFDSLNVEPTTSRLRADIFMAQDSGDNGTSWQPSARITDQGTWSCRFPSAIDYFEDDTFRLSYVIDQVAGLYPSQGAASRNPVVVQKVPLALGVAEGKGPMVSNVDLWAVPNPFARATTISYQLGSAGSVALTVLDVTGRIVRTLASGHQKAGSYSVTWDSRDNRGRQVPRGVYFYRLDTPGFRSVQKAVVTR
jgi:hypothetical protein